MKYLNRKNEQLALAAEGASVMADWFGGVKYPHYTLDEAWKRLLWHQFHDDLTGTSIPEAYRFSYNDEYIDLNQFDNVLHTAVNSVSSAMDTNVKGEPIVVYNPVSAVNMTPVELEVTLASGMSDVMIYDKNGNRVKSQIVHRSGNQIKVIFESIMPPMSLCVYDLRQCRKPSKSESKLKATSNTLENSIYRIQLNEKGDVISFYDKRCSKEIVKKGEAFALSIFTDNKSFSWPAWEILKPVIDREPKCVADNVAISISEYGALRATLKVERKYGNSRFVQEYTMTDGAQDDRVDVRCYVDWQSEASLLKASFPVSFSAENATYDLGAASIVRGNNTETAYETYGHQWADITADDGSYGLTIMNDCKYGWDKPDDNTLRLTLLHTPQTGEWCSNQATQDIGEHRFTYSICGHPNVLKKEHAAASSDALNQNKIAYFVTKHSGSIGREFSMLHTDASSLHVKALKKSQNGDGIIVRTYELSGNPVDGKIIFPADILYAVEVNGVEEEIAAVQFSGRELNVKADGFEPKSFRVHLAAPAVNVSSPDCEQLHLPYNELAFTSDAFSSFGHMDDDWHSYAAELIPENLTFNNVPFRMGEADKWNALCCKGGSIQLPEGTTSVAMLVASSNGDRNALFEAGKRTTVEIPYYTGFYGSYGWKGYYESFIRSGDVAYVGTHRHDSRKRNEIMEYTYMYYVVIPVEKGCRILNLPNDRFVTIFAATAIKDR